MADEDKLVYFSVRARAEPIRMLYVLAGEKFVDERHDLADWPGKREVLNPPLGQLPIFTTKEGLLCQTTTISRYVGKKLGLVGNGLWDETLNDLIVETLQEFINDFATKFILWKILKIVPEPDDSDKILNELREGHLRRIEYIRSISEKKGGHKFLLDDKMQLADVWLYTTLEWTRPAFPDAMEITPWVVEYVSKFENDPTMKEYLASRPETLI
ncbi:glutathione S-transferase 1-like [Watersipora subatra]|uniref:glutathione S-transferase 1-like n=1 Tax=Watersipora subatra TaxID=2589382 RepID=UPI00355AEEE5